MTLVVWSSHFEAAPEQLFAFHRDARNLPAISPPLLTFELLSPAKSSEAGDTQTFRMGIGPLKSTWTARITRVAEPKLIEDVQTSGLFRAWRHQHRVGPDGAGSRLTDVVSFRLLPGRPGEFVEYFTVRPALIAMFVWRHRRTRALLGQSRRSLG